MFQNFNTWGVFLKNKVQMRQSVVGSETIIWREKERPKIRTVQMDSLRGLLGIRKMNKVPNTHIRQLCAVKNVKWVDCGRAGLIFCSLFG